MRILLVVWGLVVGVLSMHVAAQQFDMAAIQKWGQAKVVHYSIVGAYHAQTRAPVETILFYGFGEPFLHRDSIPFLRATKQLRPEIFIATSTNALPNPYLHPGCQQIFQQLTVSGEPSQI